jgi:hypothetical protein
MAAVCSPANEYYMSDSVLFDTSICSDVIALQSKSFANTGNLDTVYNRTITARNKVRLLTAA